jgi:PAS domain S-box-containing protein
MSKPLKVLHVEDSERDVALLTRHLKRAGYDLTSKRVETAAAMRAALTAQAWDVILCDYSMPHFNALGALAVLKETGLDIPFIIISGTVGEAVAVEAMRTGAQDYLMKDNLARLLPAIERELVEAANRRARQQAEAALRASEDRYRDLVEHSHDLICTHDLTGRILSINQTAARTFGADQESLIGLNIRDVLLPEYRSGFDNYLGEIQQTGSARGLMTIHTKSGDKRVWEYSNTLRTEGVAAPIVRGLARDVTEQKRAEEALKASEAELRALFAAMTDVILVLDTEGRYVKIAPTDPAYLYKPSADLIGKRLDEVFPQAQARFFLTHIRRTLVEGRMHRVEYSLNINDKKVWFDGSVSPLTADAVLWIARDITERKLAEESLRESEERYRLLFEANPHPMWVYDLETLRFLAVNEAAVRHYGYTREEFFTMTIKDIRPAEDVPALLENVTHRRGGLDEAGVWRHRTKDGRIIAVEITSHELLFAGRRAEVVLANDVTERMRVEAALRRAEEQYRSIFEHAVEGIFQSTPDGRFIAVNPALARILGYASPAELIAERAEIGTQHFVDPNCRAELLQLLTERDVVAGFECEVYRKDRSKMWVVENIRAIRDERGRLRNYEGSIEDIHERKTLEAQFRQAQRLEAVGQLAGGVAHDFNNLLTAITGYSDLALRRLRPEDPLHHHLDEIRKAAERAGGLTRQLLAFSRKQVLQPKVIDLNAVVADVDKMLRRLIGEDIDLLTVLRAEPPAIRADPGQIEQVLMNLAVNARDAMPAGGQLTIETTNVDLNEEYASQHIGVAPGPYVMLAVSDTGCGMDAETRARIFEPFFTTKELGKGTGLGLSTVYGIVKQSGGNIWVYSEVGRGTTFKVYLPSVDAAAEQLERAAPQLEIPTGHETILLVEDEELVRTLAHEVLQMSGYRVLVAANGGAALLICERHTGPIHLLLTDIVMPELSGQELAERLTRLRPDMRVLFMSGYTNNAVIHNGTLAAVVNYIQKPFSPDALARKVREVLDEAA